MEAKTDDDQPLDLSTKRHLASVSPVSGTSGSTEIVQLLTKPQSRRNPCPCCGIGFSSEKTLKAHTQFYCTKLVNGPENPAIITFPVSAEPVRIKPVPAPDLPSAANSPNETASEKSRSGQFCTYCAFRANTVRGLRSHITKYHLRDASNTSKNSAPRQLTNSSQGKRPKIDGATPVMLVNGTTEKKKYCKYCDIYFKYLSTFLAHRKFYCTVRKEGNTEAAKPGSTGSEVV